MNKKISRRLQAIVDLYQNEEVVWDLCCDHGLIGSSLPLEKIRKIHFVDIVPSIIENIKKIHQPRSDKYSFHAIDASRIKLSPGFSHLVIIAGVGGKAAIDILSPLLPQIPSDQLSLILSVHRDQRDLRLFLKNKGLRLEFESILEDKGHFYEMLKISPHGQLAVTAFGQNMWQNGGEEALGYFKQLQSYYGKKAQHTEMSEFLSELRDIGKLLRIEPSNGVE